MAKVKVEFWMFQGKEMGKEFESPTDTRAVLETSVEEGTTVRSLFEDLANRYSRISEKIFKDHRFNKLVVVAVNGRGVHIDKVYDRVLRDGDRITLIPTSMGG